MAVWPPLQAEHVGGVHLGPWGPAEVFQGDLRMSLEHERPKANLREFAVAMGAVAVCVSALVIGTWVFFRLSGAGDELRAVHEAASVPGGLRNVTRGFGGPEKIMAAWSV